MARTPQIPHAAVNGNDFMDGILPLWSHLRTYIDTRFQFRQRKYGLWLDSTVDPQRVALWEQPYREWPPRCEESVVVHHIV